MAKDIVMPKMGYDMTEGKLLRWIKHEGDTIAKGEAIAEIETDKVNIEVEAFDSGILKRIVVQEGQTVPVGERIGVVAAPNEALPDETRPAVADSDASAQNPMATIAAGGNGRAPIDPSTEIAPGDRIKASPLARRLAQEHALNLASIAGTGPGGRVTRDDVLEAARSAVRTQQPAALSPAIPVETGAPLSPPVVIRPPEPLPALADAAGERPLSRLQQTMARRMVESKTQAPHFYLTIDIDMTAAVTLRRQLNEQVEEGARISVNDFVVKATALALARFPALNASYAGDKLVLHHEIAVAVAVAIDEGLVTPVVRETSTKSLGQIARETRALAERARTGKSRLEDYEGGTFTVSNLGMFGVDTFVAIINPPHAAILAIGAVRRVPVYVGDELVPRERMSVTLSADHRVTDGATGARFLAELRGYLENPLRLVL